MGVGVGVTFALTKGSHDSPMGASHCLSSPWPGGELQGIFR